MFLPLLLAVTTIVQDTTPRATPRVRQPSRVQPPVVISPMVISAAVLEQAAVALSAAQIELQMAAPQLAVLALQAPVLATSAQQLSDAANVLEALPDLDVWDGEERSRQDPGDSLYRAGRSALNRSQYTRAAELFKAVRERYPRSSYVPNSYYWEAFALYRKGSGEDLRAARALLREQAEKHAKASTRREADVLMTRIQGSLAQMGDAEAAQEIAEDVEAIAPRPPREARPPREPRPPKAPRPPRPGRSSTCDDEDDVRIAALNAVQQMNAERAVPLLKSVLGRRDEGSTCLRRTAVFLLSQKRSPETAKILLDAVRSDPDRQVREDAIFWLSQVPGEETVIALDSILRASDDPDVQEKALFAISQNRSPRGAAILRDFAQRQSAPANLRENAIFWLGQRRSAENAEFLRGLYTTLESEDLKDKVIFSVSQMGGAENYRWMMDIALNEREGIERRKNALFWAGQSRSVDIADLVRLYDSMKDREMRGHLIFVYSQRREEAALDKLFAIGKNEPDRELRKQAIFWIGQSRSPRAAQYLQELINQ